MHDTIGQILKGMQGGVSGVERYHGGVNGWGAVEGF